MKLLISTLAVLFTMTAFGNEGPAKDPDGIGEGAKLRPVYVEVCDMRRVGDDYEVIEGTCRMEKRYVNYTSGGDNDSEFPGDQK